MSKSNSKVMLSSTLIIKNRLGIFMSKSLKGKDMLAFPFSDPNSVFASTSHILDFVTPCIVRSPTI